MNVTSTESVETAIARVLPSRTGSTWSSTTRDTSSTRWPTAAGGRADEVLTIASMQAGATSDAPA